MGRSIYFDLIGQRRHKSSAGWWYEACVDSLVVHAALQVSPAQTEKSTKNYHVCTIKTCKCFTHVQLSMRDRTGPHCVWVNSQLFWKEGNKDGTYASKIFYYQSLFVVKLTRLYLVVNSSGGTSWICFLLSEQPRFKVLEAFLRDVGLYWHNNIRQLQ